MQVVEQLKRMSEERFLALYESLAQQGFGPLDRQVAVSLKFRPQAIRKLPMAQRAKRARTLVLAGGKGELAYDLLGSYLMKKDKELITAFLDKTGVEHNDGMIEDLDEHEPAPDKIAPAVAELDTEHDPEDVTSYLAMCATQWPEITELDALWRERAGVPTA